MNGRKVPVRRRAGCVLVLFALAVSLPACGQSASQKSSVRMSALVDSLQPAITLEWEAQTGASGHTVYRRVPGASAWGAPVATLAGGATGWTDNAVSVGLAYEYKVHRTGTNAGYGYVRSGIAVAPVEDRGSLVLLVDSALAADLGGQVQDLVNDLTADGWWVHRHDVPGSLAVPDVKALVTADAQQDPDVEAIYLLGHIAVPYSGNLNPDGHAEHRGAWACDAFYGDLDGQWTDVSVNSTSAAFPRNHNLPQDGKFDQSDLPSPVELAVGRVDLSDLPSYSQSETQLVASYLDRAHAWKTGALTVPAEALLFDDLQWTAYPLSQSGHMGLAACVGPDHLTEVPPNNGPFSDHVLSTPALWGYQCGAGLQGTGSNNQVTFVGTTNGIRTQDVVQGDVGTVFNMAFGSYFGDWDNEDNFLRAMLGSGNSLVHLWSGIPNWYVYPMAMGGPVGSCMRISVNNTQQDHAPQNAGWQGQNMGRVHMALMGDPTLRQSYVGPPTDLVVGPSGWTTQFSWSPSSDDVDGYLVHRIDTVSGGFVRVTPQVVTDTFFVSTELYAPGTRYLVRAIKLVTSNTGSYFDLSLGASAQAMGPAVPDCENVPGGPAIPGTPCDDGDPLTIQDTFDETCACVGVSTIGIEEQVGRAIIVVQVADGLLVDMTMREGGTQPYQVFDVRGRVVLNGTLGPGRNRIRSQDLRAGLYVLAIPGAAFVHRFVVGGR